jgi:hypothetical protein
MVRAAQQTLGWKNLLPCGTVGLWAVPSDRTLPDPTGKDKQLGEETSSEDPVDALSRLINCRVKGQLLLVICCASALDHYLVLDGVEFIQSFQ